MKKTVIISALILAAAVAVVSCDSKREPGKIYMPDMAYSRAYETYALRDSTIFTTDPSQAGHKIFYNSLPVKGTVRMGELPEYTVPNDSTGLITLSAQVKNPLPALNTTDSLEAARLFNINCAICHGAKAEANGPVAAKIGGVKSIISALNGTPTTPGFSDGRIFHVMTYGQVNMGSYASQLTRKQRWMIVHYLRSLQPQTAAAAPAAATTPAVVKADSATAKK
ncbi:MAG: cytochrome c [Ferruginibacter sp.]